MSATTTAGAAAITTSIGIHDIAFATGSYRIDLAELAARHGVEANKYYIGLGQSEMSVLANDEDVVTMAATAAQRILDRGDSRPIRTLIFATETGIDQSKAAGVYVHRLLGLGSDVRVVEVKQACYSATAALQFATALVARSPEEAVLVVASDVARYEIDSNAEATQGAGAVAMLVTADPAILEIEPVSGLFTEDVMDFWRPNHRSTAVVDGKLSIDAYINATTGAWADLASRGGPAFESIERFCYHQPFTRMAVKAHRKLAASVAELGNDEADVQLDGTFDYNRRIGNSYTASIYLALAALLDTDDDLAGKRLGFLSYGSGAVSEFFTGIVSAGYREHVRADENRALLDGRTPIGDEQYLALQRFTPADVSNYETTRETPGRFRFGGVDGDKRVYEVV
ncbi:hydroxymethylglutaryl-CoA synthase [Agromyces atrinae]|jgi:hydroxymethylglutaryl-CoA synthase|uniref:Hydroxymethylglutaryl-CoA synthase n=1 Tax=Agromyces atrinae TaxID=592376 RepID=A0A4Q2MCU6_9MICO|nr:hydroxymethylglutaryl-CoA synthase [Agromyces atrinae]NYD67248.1 hydroxymethylglutaryl-CoA synthase [Agromyces atrinae]RXZ86920.1 hydroxymethylglutaryl-CoA synthase [Agromyces atrinae]